MPPASFMNECGEGGGGGGGGAALPREKSELGEITNQQLAGTRLEVLGSFLHEREEQHSSGSY